MARHGAAYRERLLAQELPPPPFWAELTPTQRQGNATNPSHNVIPRVDF